MKQKRKESPSPSPSPDPSPVGEGRKAHPQPLPREGRPAANKSIFSPLPNRGGVGGGAFFFLLTWLWASWWMGDVMRIAYERSFFAPDATLMHWLWQQKFGWLWIAGRALLTLYHWPLVGALLVATLLTAASQLFGYSLRLSLRWRWLQYLPAAAWMCWTANAGLNLYYKHEPGRILAIPLLFMVLCATVSLITWMFRVESSKLKVESWAGAQQAVGGEQIENSKLKIENWAGAQQTVGGEQARSGKPAGGNFQLSIFNFQFPFILLLLALPVIILHFRHPYMRPLTRMQVQLMHNNFEGISRTAHEHPEMSYRQTAGYYVIALARTGQLADHLFDIKLDYDTIWTEGYHGQPTASLNYHIVDCNYHAGLIRAARHYAIEELTMDGPSLFTLKYLVKISLLEGDWALARKYLHILHKVPFERAFLRQYEPMVERPDLVQADPEFAAVKSALPPFHTFEQMYEKPGFVGFYATLHAFTSPEMLTWSAVACLYSKRMPDFLQRCRRLVGKPLPRSIAEGLVLQAAKNPDILKAFPQLEMLIDRFQLFVQDAMPYMKDRELGSQVLFEKYHGYYPYYYFFGNLRSTRKPIEEKPESNKAGVN